MADPTANLDFGSMTASQRDELINNVKVQVAAAQMQELIQKLQDKCIKKCIPHPGTYLDNSEKKCLTYCVDRFMDVWNISSRAFQTRLQQEGGASSFQ